MNWLWARSSFEDVAALADVPPGSLLGVRTRGGEDVCLFNHEGEVGAVHNACTHADFALSDGQLLPNGCIECTWHGAQFDAVTGAVCRGPADTPVARFQTRIEHGRILVGPPA